MVIGPLLMAAGLSTVTLRLFQFSQSGLLGTDESVLVTVEPAEVLQAADKLLAGHVAVPVAIHRQEPRGSSAGLRSRSRKTDRIKDIDGRQDPILDRGDSGVKQISVRLSE